MPLVAQSPKNRIILGCMVFGPDKDGGARVTSLDEYNKILDAFQGAGYNEIDTARNYVNGKQEAFTAAAHWKDRGLTIATKCYPNKPGMHKAEEITASLNKSLGELQTDCVDIFYLHAPDRSVPFAETLEAVDKMHKQGKFVRLGLSNFTAFEVAEVVMTCKMNGWVRPTVYQGMYNAILRGIEQELIVACHRYGIDIVIYNPLAGGLFSGKIKSKDIVPEDGRFGKSAMGERYRARYFQDATFEALSIIEPVVEKHGLTMLETALRWCVHHSKLKITNGTDGIIIGASSLAQLESNLKDFEKGPLPEEVVKALDEAWLVCKATTPNYWHLDLNYTYDTQKVLFG
ncbi:Aldo/keto reductase [Rhizodiscina lignyota]|uniref:Aldo/keto reductase n=1 Tax=Rhizodiscina lignyota TaxID=1504668 RepID=A0A9P4IND2_9PEZI|nr:Aldo/keto reductase [Rhizodiscina lignyota]